MMVRTSLLRWISGWTRIFASSVRNGADPAKASRRGRGRSLLGVGVIALSLLALSCGEDPAETDAKVVKLVFGSRSHTINLSDMEGWPREDGSIWIPLVDLYAESGWKEPFWTLRVDFESEEGFHPAHSGNCLDWMPIPGEMLRYGVISQTDGTLYWGETEEGVPPRCLFVERVGRILFFLP